MIDSDSMNAKSPDSISGKKVKNIFDLADIKGREDDGAITRSVSVLNGYCDNEKEKQSGDLSCKGVPMKSFDSLIEHMASLNVKFFH